MTRSDLPILRLYISILISLTLTGCISPDEQSAHKDFTVALGRDNVLLLDSLIDRMEIHLHETYGQSEQENYMRYFEDLAKGITPLRNSEEQPKTLNTYQQSNLGYQYSCIEYDTVYDNGNGIVSVLNGDTTETIPILAQGESYSDLIQSMKDFAYLHLESRGDLISALESVRNKSEMLSQYLDRKEKVHVVNPKLMAEYLFQNDIPVSGDLILKSIVLTEIYLDEMGGQGYPYE